MMRTSPAHEEGGERVFSVSTRQFAGTDDGRVRALQLTEVSAGPNGFEPVPGTEREIPADLVLLAMGFVGPERSPLLDQLGVALDARGTVTRNSTYGTSVEGVFVAGDAGRGQSLIVWAIAEGRAAAAAVDTYLMGSTELPAPVAPTDRPLVA
jgi:glutamate synthase (NADPH/NADH) small chain